MKKQCISATKAKLNTDKSMSDSIAVCYTHDGHSKQIEFEHTRITERSREQIATCLQQGASKQRIGNDIREEAINQCNLDFKRHHMATRKDLNNTEKSFELDTIHRHADDQMSCQVMIEEL